MLCVVRPGAGEVAVAAEAGADPAEGRVTDYSTAGCDNCGNKLGAAYYSDVPGFPGMGNLCIGCHVALVDPSTFDAAPCLDWTRTTANNLAASLAIAGMLAYLEEIEERADRCNCDVGYSGGCGCGARIGNLIGGDLDDLSTLVLGEWEAY